MVQGTSATGQARARVPTLTVDHLVRWARSTVLEDARADIDALNVFPVPDGDTGTNLALTWQAARESLESALSAAGPPAGQTAETQPETQLPALLSAWARGALMGARGNSGVISAQLLRGWALTVAAAAERHRPPGVDAGVRADALEDAVALAYSAVMHPVEGTILTVASEAARAARSAVDGAAAGDGEAGGLDVVTVLAAAVEAADEALVQTPEQLEVLARAGVVDAGGQGLVLVLGALLAAVDPTAPDEAALLARWGLGQGSGTFVHAPRPTGRALPDGAFEVMYLLDAADDAVPDLRLRLDQLGASVVVVGGGGLWNVHVHTDDAGPAVEAGVAVGHVSRIRITPLLAASADTHAPDGRESSGHGRPVRGVVAVASGPPLAALFESVGARVVRGTAGDRPTPGSLVAAAEGAAEVLLLPNDDAHRGVAEAAASELRARGVTVAVLPTRAAVQGLAALAVHEAGLPFTDDLVAMTAAAGATRHGAVTRAERQAITSAGICEPGDVLGLVEGDIAIIGSDPAETVCGVVDRMLSAGGELVTLVCGDDPWPGHALAEAVRQHLHRTRLDVEIVVYDGGQPLYPVLVGVE